MGLSLKKLENIGAGIVRQVNPFDNGATYSRPNSAAPAPSVNQNRNVLQRSFDQINPYDNGRTYQSAVPTNNRSVVGQATHNGATNVIGDMLVKPFLVNPLQIAAETERMTAADVTNNVAAQRASQSRQATNLKASVPYWAANQVVRGTQAAANTAFIAPINDIMGNEAAANKARTTGLNEFNQTIAGQLTRPIQVGVANVGKASKEKRAAAGLNPDATGAQQYFADPVTGALAVTGAAKGFKGKAKVTEKAAPAKPVEPKVDVQKYIDEQTRRQATARKAENATPIRSAVADLKTKTIDSLSPIEDKYNTRITPGNAADHITPQLDRVIQSDKIAGQTIVDLGLDKVIQGVDSTKNLDQYLIAKRAIEVGGRDIETGRNLAADKQLVKQLAPKYEAQAQQVHTASRALLTKMATPLEEGGYGLIDRSLAEQLIKDNPNYVPLQRIFDEVEQGKVPGGAGAGKASLSKQTIVQRLKGSKREIESPLSSIVDQVQRAVKQGETNRAASMLVDAKDPAGGSLFDMRPLRKNEAIGTKSTVSVIRNGVKEVYETTPEISAAAKSLNRQQLGLLGQIVSYQTRLLRLGATGLSPSFAVANVIKDVGSALLNSENGRYAFHPDVVAKSFWAAMNHRSPEYQELLREGAAGTSFDIARNEAVQNVKSIRSQKNLATRFNYVATSPGGLIRAIENTIGRSEELTRASQYYSNKKAAVAKGANDANARSYAAHAARNNTVNFGRAGDYGKVMNTALPYLNAGIQGARIFNRNFVRDPRRFAAKLTVLGVLPTATITAWNMGTPERRKAYEDVKEYEKQGNWIIMPPNPVKGANGKWNAIVVPVSQEIANLNNIIRRSMENAVNGGKIDAKKALGDIIGTTTSLQVQEPRQAVGQFVPQAAKPVIETILNKNLYYGNDIVPASQKDLDPRDQYGTGTSGTAKVIGKGLNWSPRLIDNAIKTSTASVGQNVVNASDRLLAATGVIKPDEVKGKSISQSVKDRLSSADGSTEYDAIDKTKADLVQRLKERPGYKSMSPSDKAKAINRLSNEVVSTYTTDKSLSERQQAIKDGKPDIDGYLQASNVSAVTKLPKGVNRDTVTFYKSYDKMNATARDKARETQNDFQYREALAAYDKNKNGGTMNDVEKQRAEDNLTKLKVGATYPKEVRDLYGMTREKIASYLTSHPNKADDYVAKLIAYDKALKDSGVIATLKYGKASPTVAALKKGRSSKNSAGRTATVNPYAHVVKSRGSVKAAPTVTAHVTPRKVKATAKTQRKISMKLTKSKA